LGVVAGAFVLGYIVVSRLYDRLRGKRASPALDVGGPAANGQKQEDARRLQSYFRLFSMGGQIAGADGVIGRGEETEARRFADEQLGLSANVRDQLMGLITLAQKSLTPFEHHADEFRRLNRDDPSALAQGREWLERIARADGEPNAEQTRMLEAARERFQS
jgi:hypothetical protein